MPRKPSYAVPKPYSAVQKLASDFPSLQSDKGLLRSGEGQASVRFISLGCPKNLVDSEVMLGHLTGAGYQISPDNKPNQEANTGLLMVDTCCFIDEAEQESRDIIKQAIDIRESFRKNHPGQNGYKIVVSGCMAQRYADRLNKDFKGQIDGIIGISERDKVIDLCDSLINNSQSKNTVYRAKSNAECRTDGQRMRITPTHYAYLRIAEGCDNRCSYCIIPSLHGSYRSKPMDKVIAEASVLVASGVKEINLIAQDISSYGKDINSSLAELLRKLAGLKGLKWIRLLYTHPAHFTDELIDAIRDIDKVVKYVDLPIQHISDRMLASMGRHTTSNRVRRLIDKIRQKIPGVFIRTSVIVGFPGETAQDFQELMDFIRDTEFERLGAFEYSREKDTPAYQMAHQVPAKVKKQRLDKVMLLQQGIAFSQNQALKGRLMDAIIDSSVKPGFYLGRIYGDAPDVDGNIIIKSKTKLLAGDIVNIKVTGSKDYDLKGELVDEYTK